MEASRFTAELPGKEVSLHHVPFIQRVRSGPPRPRPWCPATGVRTLNNFTLGLVSVLYYLMFGTQRILRGGEKYEYQKGD